MPRFAANLTMMFTEHAFLDRFQAARDAGFDAVEFMFPYDHDVDDVVKAKETAGVDVALFNLQPGDFAHGERGLAAWPGREVEWRESVARALLYAPALQCTRLHGMAGLIPEDLDPARVWSTYVDNIKLAADQFADHGIRLLLEPINQRSMPGYYLSSYASAERAIVEADRANVRLQFDFFHCQIIQGDLLTTFRQFEEHIGHIQIAGVPDRHEPDTGEVHYPNIFRAIDASGYEGFIGCEYMPAGQTTNGLGWFEPYRR